MKYIVRYYKFYRKDDGVYVSQPLKFSPSNGKIKYEFPLVDCQDEKQPLDATVHIVREEWLLDNN